MNRLKEIRHHVDTCNIQPGETIWLLDMVERMKLYVLAASMSPHSSHQGIKKAHALLAELEGK